MRCDGCGFDSVAAQIPGSVDAARAHRDVHLARFPDLDAMSRRNLNEFVTWAEALEANTAPWAGPKAAGWSAGAEYTHEPRSRP